MMHGQTLCARPLCTFARWSSCLRTATWTPFFNSTFLMAQRCLDMLLWCRAPGRRPSTTMWWPVDLASFASVWSSLTLLAFCYYPRLNGGNLPFSWCLCWRSYNDGDELASSSLGFFWFDCGSASAETCWSVILRPLVVNFPQWMPWRPWRPWRPNQWRPSPKRATSPWMCHGMAKSIAQAMDARAGSMWEKASGMPSAPNASDHGWAHSKWMASKCQTPSFHHIHFFHQNLSYCVFGRISNQSPPLRCYYYFFPLLQGHKGHQGEDHMRAPKALSTMGPPGPGYASQKMVCGKTIHICLLSTVLTRLMHCNLCVCNFMSTQCFLLHRALSAFCFLEHKVL